jgi:hypothetical protein
VRNLGWGFSAPDAASSDGTDIWATDVGGDSVTELNTSSGVLTITQLQVVKRRTQ